MLAYNIDHPNINSCKEGNHQYITIQDRYKSKDIHSRIKWCSSCGKLIIVEEDDDPKGLPTVVNAYISDLYTYITNENNFINI